MKKYSGFTKSTQEHLLLNAGAYFKNYDVEKDTYDTAVAAGKLIGATRGGGQFDAVPTVRQIQVDGVSGRAKGLEQIDDWDVALQANVLEIKKETLQAALIASKVETATLSGYKKITAKQNIELTDYIDNITWIGTVSGSDEPVIIVVKNALNIGGLQLKTEDKNESVISMKFYGHYEQGELDAPPFEIYYPDIEANSVAQTTTSNS